MENAKFGYTSILQYKLKKLLDLIFLLNRLLKMHVSSFTEKNPNSITEKENTERYLTKITSLWNNITFTKYH